GNATAGYWRSTSSHPARPGRRQLACSDRDEATLNTFPEPGRRARIARGLLLMGALTAVLMVVAVACGGGDNGDDNNEGGMSRTPVMMTFTPTTEADATNRVATQEAMEEARETAIAATATWQAENPPPPTWTPDPNATPK